MNNESLRQWFKDDWVRIDTQGNITGKCGTMKKGKKTTRCLPRKKAQSLTKAQRKSTVAKKTKSKKQYVSNTKAAGGRKKSKKENITMEKSELFNIIKEQVFEVLTEGLCKKGKAYVAKRKRAGEKHSAYLMGRASKVCKGSMKGEMITHQALDFNYNSNRKDYQDMIDEVDMHTEDLLEMEVIDENITEAKYKGKTVTLNKPMRGDSKKFKVYVNSGKKNADGSIKVKKVNFGAKGMNIKKNNPKRRKAFRARHRCDNPGPKTMARYWSCKKW